MALENYRDLSSNGSDIGSGFQYEFYCTHCNHRWKSPFKPYRMGQITGLLTRFAFLFQDSGVRTAGRASNNFADMGSRGAQEKALAEAQARAQTMFTECPGCRKAVCGDCFSAREDRCKPCLAEARDEASREQRRQADLAQQGGAQSCPSCHQPHAGGRFCGECGFDMASTHKSCPTCGAMVGRQARYCTDCGHGF